VKLKLLSVSAVLCLAMMITGARAGSAQELQPLEPEWLRQMYAEGWQKVQEGVLQRETGEGQPETFTYGAEGTQWVIGNLQQQVSLLESRYNEYPDEDLADLIDEMKGEILRLEASIESAPSAESFDGSELENCNVSWGGDAFAGSQSGTQGVTASSSAYFHNNCGYYGDTFAMAYAHAIAGTVETTKIQNDPKSGTWVDSSASASANGSTGCESYSQGQVTVYALNISYLTPFRHNTNCSLPPQAFVNGTPDYYTDYYSPCANVTWTASASGGTGVFTYEWYIGGVYQGSGSTLTRQYCNQTASVTVSLVARDSAGATAGASYTSNVYHFNNSNPCDYDPYAYGCPCYNGGGGFQPYDRPYEICPYI
jgi:hypothetical protein